MGISWDGLLDVLEDISDIYERANKLMTFFTLNWMRRYVGVVLKSYKGILLDVGCGPGVMIKPILKYNDKIHLYIALDPLDAMLKKIDPNYDVRLDRIKGVFEFLPLRNDSVDICLATFSFRDAKNYVRSMKNVFDVLKQKGVFVILDIYKGEDSLGLVIRKLYFNVIPRIVGFILRGTKGLYLYSWFYLTFERFLSEHQMRTLSQKVGFREIKLMRILKMVALWTFIK